MKGRRMEACNHWTFLLDNQELDKRRQICSAMDFVLKKTIAVDLFTPLSEYIASRCNGNDMAEMVNVIQDIGELRRTISNISSFSEQALQLYTSYYEYLEQLYYAFPSGESINGLMFSWTDIHGIHSTMSGDINAERANVLMNLAILYNMGAEKLLAEELQYENVVIAIEYGKKSLSIILYIQDTIAPILRESEVTWDLSKLGLQAIESYLNACYHHYHSIQKTLTEDDQLSICYCRRSSEYYSKCIYFLGQIRCNLEPFINKINFLQTYYLCSSYLEYVRSCFEQDELLPGQEQLPFALLVILQNSITRLKSSPQYKESFWRKSIDTLVINVNEMNTIGMVLGFPENINVDNALKNIPPCDIDVPPSFSFLHKLDPLFDSLLSTQTLIQVHSLQKEFNDYCKRHVYDFQKQLQDCNHNIASLNISSAINSVMDTRSFLIGSFSKVEFLQSSGQLTIMEDNYRKVSVLKSNCVQMITQLQRDASAELQEEIAANASHPELEVHRDYLTSIQSWLANTMNVLNSKNESLIMYSKQVEIFKKHFSNIHQKRLRLDQMPPLVLTSSLQAILNRLIEKNEKVEGLMSTANSCIKRMEKLCADDMAIRMAVQNGVNMQVAKQVVHNSVNAQNLQMTKQAVHNSVNAQNLQMTKQAVHNANTQNLQMTKQAVFERVHVIVNDITMKIKDIHSCYLQLKKECDEFEEEMRKNPSGGEQRELLESINYIDQTYQSCAGFVQHALTEFDGIVNSTSQLLNDFSKYRRRMQENRAMVQTPISSPGELRVEPVQSIHTSKSGKGWTCSICGIVNDINAITCDGCLQRRI